MVGKYSPIPPLGWMMLRHFLHGSSELSHVGWRSAAHSGDLLNSAASDWLSLLRLSPPSLLLLFLGLTA